MTVITDTTGVGVHVDLGDGSSSNEDEVGNEVVNIEDVSGSGVVDLEDEVGAGGGVDDVGT